MNIYEQWEAAVEVWKRGERKGFCPAKPLGYDFWKQGREPLFTEKIEPIKCNGGPLVESWLGNRRRIRTENNE